MSFFITSTILCILGVIIIYWIHNQNQLDIVVTPTLPPSDAPLISICIPARNEEMNIRRCVESALGQDYPKVEVIVVDDRSTDGTLAILESDSYVPRSGMLSKLKEQAPSIHKFQIVHGSELPSGWAGKPHALYQASAVAIGDWLCFVDADTTLSKEALSSCYTKALETEADLFTVMNRQVLGSFWEKTVMPLVMTALSVGFSPRKINDPSKRDAVANGQFILIKRSVYHAVGGHERIKEQIVEDKALSEQVKWNGYRLIVADGSQVVSTRMYTSLATMWEGWTKNMYLGLRDHTAMLLLGVFGAVLALFAALFLPIWPLLGLAWYLRDGGWIPLAVIIESLMIWVALVYARSKVAKYMGISTFYAWITPLGAGVFAAMMITSAWKVISGKGVVWRGRSYHP